MKRSSPKVTRTVALGAAGGLLIWAVLWGMRDQIKDVNRTVSDVSDLKDPSPFRAALMGHLGKIHLGLEGDLRSPDPSLEKQIDESRKDFEALLPDFMQQNPKLFTPAVADEIKRTFTLYKAAIAHTLEANTQRVERRGALEKNFDRILFLIDHNMRPLIRKTQADGEERSEAILNIENQLRAWQQNLAQAWSQPSEAAQSLTFENDSRGETYLELYSHMELLGRERQMLREIRSLWQASSDIARETFVKESIVDQAQRAMEAERVEMVSTLNKFLPVLPPAEMEAKKQSIMNAMRLHLAAAGALGLLGLVFLAAIVVAMYRQLRPPAPAFAPAALKAALQMDLKGQITEWDSGAQALYGYSAAEMRGQSIGKLFESESEIARLGQELGKAKLATFETTHKTRTGAAVPVRIEFRPVPDATGHAGAIQLICSRR